MIGGKGFFYVFIEAHNGDAGNFERQFFFSPGKKARCPEPKLRVAFDACEYFLPELASADEAFITGTVKEKHVIDAATCIKCGSCVEKCRFGAIEKR